MLPSPGYQQQGYQQQVPSFPQQPVMPAAYLPSPHVDLAAEESMVRWALRLPWLYVAVLLLNALFYVGAGRQIRDSFRQAFHSLQSGVATSQATAQVSGAWRAVSAVGDITQLVLIVLGVLFLIWQYRAARVARNLGYPATHSPGFGVGCWFIPIVNLWMPYQAMRDCLPPSHPIRHRLIYAWLIYLLNGIGTGAGIVLILTGVQVLGDVIALGSVAVFFYGATVFVQFVRAVGEDHHRVITERWGGSRR